MSIEEWLIFVISLFAGYYAVSHFVATGGAMY